MKMKNSIKLTLALAATFGLALAAAADTAQLPPAATKQGVTYAADIKPVFDQSCVKCHSGEKPKAKLKLDSLENALKGRDRKSTRLTSNLNQGVTYAADIKPVFDQSCVKCHSGEKPKAKLKLDSLENALKGSKDGKVVIPGNSAKSPLVLNVAHLSNDKDTWMPPAHNKANIGPLTPEQIGLIRAWIDQGAK